VRGFRFELGEVEAALSEHGAIRDAVVVAREDGPGNERLVAYYVAAGEVSATELRAFLRRRLPKCMLPAVFVPLEAMPRSPNGKIDREALSAPGGGRSALDVAYVAPRTPAEVVLAGIWTQLLGLDQVGVHDDFFEQGGDSFGALRLVGMVRDALGVELPVRAVVTNPTIEGLAAALREAAACERRSPAAPAPAAGAEEAPFLEHPAGGTAA
jgi:hypothetical protein